jgi:hypothetical protein
MGRRTSSCPQARDRRHRRGRTGRDLGIRAPARSCRSLRTNANRFRRTRYTNDQSEQPSLDHGKRAEPTEPDASESRERVCERYAISTDWRDADSAALVPARARVRQNRAASDETGRTRVHPPTRVRGAHGRANTTPLPRPARRQAAPEAERDAVHVAVLSRHDPLAQSGDRRTTQARDRPVVGRPTGFDFEPEPGSSERRDGAIGLVRDARPVALATARKCRRRSFDALLERNLVRVPAIRRPPSHRYRVCPGRTWTRERGSRSLCWQ